MLRKVFITLVAVIVATVKVDPYLGGVDAVLAAAENNEIHRSNRFTSYQQALKRQFPGLKEMPHRPGSGVQRGNIAETGNHHDHRQLGCDTKPPSGEARAAISNIVEDTRIKNSGRNLLQATQHIIVPVGVYNFQTAYEEGVIYAEDVKDLIKTLNWGFRDTAFRFEFFGAKYVIDDNYAKCQNQREFNERFKPAGTDMLMVYFCDGNIGTASCGWTENIADLAVRELNETEYLSDGVYMMNPNLPNSKCTLEDVAQHLIHEVGHWLFLLHTWEGGCGIGEKGDGVDDTPAHVGPTIEDDHLSERCWKGLDTCPNLPGKDPYNNYMNYLTTRCYQQHGEFSHGQKERMLTLYEDLRNRYLLGDENGNKNPRLTLKPGESATFIIKGKASYDKTLNWGKVWDKHDAYDFKVESNTPTLRFPGQDREGIYDAWVMVGPDLNYLHSNIFIATIQVARLRNVPPVINGQQDGLRMIAPGHSTSFDIRANDEDSMDLKMSMLGSPDTAFELKDYGDGSGRLTFKANHQIGKYICLVKVSDGENSAVFTATVIVFKFAKDDAYRHRPR